MITIALAAVLLTVGVPAFQGLTERNQLTSHINSFISSLALARSEAVKRKRRIVVCVSNDGSTCANNGAYESGWIVYVDAVEDGARDDNNANEELLWVSEPLPANFTLRANAKRTKTISHCIFHFEGCRKTEVIAVGFPMIWNSILLSIQSYMTGGSFTCKSKLL